MRIFLTCLIILAGYSCFAQKADTVVAEPSTSELLQQAMKPHWDYVTTGQGNIKYYIRSKYQTKSNGKITIWVKRTHPTYKIKKKTYKNCYSQELWSVDCTNQRTLISQMIVYNEAGDNIESISSDDDNWVDAVPDSVGESVMLEVCRLYNK